MGNSETKPEEGDPLRDYDAEIKIPSNISKPTSNLLLAYDNGYFYPCIILARGKNIPNGYLVFFFHSQMETEIPSGNVIGNFKVLRNCNVSFTNNGKQFCGQVYDFSTNEKNEITSFFITCKGECVWVSFPFLFLTLAQAKELA